MIPSLLQGMIPLLLSKVAALSLADKRTFALYLESLCAVYMANDPDQFSDMIAKVEIPNKETLVKALFADGNQGK